MHDDKNRMVVHRRPSAVRKLRRCRNCLRLANDQLFVGGTVPQAFLDNIFWLEQGITGATQIGTQLVPVPEPINVALGVFGAMFVVFGFGRRLYARTHRPA